MDRRQVYQAGRAFTRQLLELSAAGDITPLLSAQNLAFEPNGVFLRQTAAPAGMAAMPPFGFTPPEATPGMPLTAGGQVYFVGAVLYQLLTGVAPPPAVTRNGPLISGGDPLCRLINQATDPNPQTRIQNLQVLSVALDETQRIDAPTPPAAPIPQTVPAPQAAPIPQTVPIQQTAPVPPTAPAPQAQAAPPPWQQAGAPPQAQPGGYGQPMQAAPPAQPTFTAPPTWQAPPPSSPTPYQGPKAEPQASAAPYGAVPPLPGQPQPGAAPPVKKKSKIGLVIAIVAVLLVAAVGAGVFFYVRSSRKEQVGSAYAGKNYAEVVRLLNANEWMKDDFLRQYDYSQAQVLMDAGDDEGSLALLDALGSYEDSAELAKSIRYEIAYDTLESGDLAEGADLFRDLGNYKDSAQIVRDIEAYQDAEALTEAAERYSAFQALSGFLDSGEKADAAAGEIYETALLDYNDNYIYLALSSFELIPGYKDTDIYLEALNIWMDADMDFSYVEDVLPLLRDYEDRIDIGPLCLSDACMKAFLAGDWSSFDGGAFSLSNSNSTFEFSNFSHFGSYTVGSQMLSPDDASQPTFYFDYISYDEVFVTVGADYDVYTFERQ